MFRGFGDTQNALRRFGVGGRRESTLVDLLQSNAAGRDRRFQRGSAGTFEELRGNKNTSHGEL